MVNQLLKGLGELINNITITLKAGQGPSGLASVDSVLEFCVWSSPDPNHWLYCLSNTPRSLKVIYYNCHHFHQYHVFEAYSFRLWVHIFFHFSLGKCLRLRPPPGVPKAQQLQPTLILKKLCTFLGKALLQWHKFYKFSED